MGIEKILKNEELWKGLTIGLIFGFVLSMCLNMALHSESIIVDNVVYPEVDKRNDLKPNIIITATLGPHTGYCIICKQYQEIINRTFVDYPELNQTQIKYTYACGHIHETTG